MELAQAFYKNKSKIKHNIEHGLYTTLNKDSTNPVENKWYWMLHKHRKELSLLNLKCSFLFTANTYISMVCKTSIKKAYR